MSKRPGVTSFDGIPPDGATWNNDSPPLCAGLPDLPRPARDSQSKFLHRGRFAVLGGTGNFTPNPFRGCLWLFNPEPRTMNHERSSLHAPATSLSLKYPGYYHVR